MTLKMILVLALCGFVANLPTAFGISCYACADYPGSSQPCSNPSVINCDYYYDSCMTTNISAEVIGIQYSTTAKNCSFSAYQCNSSVVCGQVNSSLSQANVTLHSCSVSCCYGDLCNGQGGGGGNVTLPPWTNPPTTYYPPFTTQNPHQGCGSVVYNKLESPGYPNNYPNSLNCVNYVNIPYGMTLNINFADFYLESGGISCRYDYLEITNDRGQSFGKYCGQRTGLWVNVTGRRAVISFRSDGSVQRRGYQLLFSFNSNATLAPSTNPPTTHNPPTTYYPPYTTQNPSQGCGSVIYNTLKSPGYPSNYPANMDCVYWVHIPHGMAMRVYFNHFYLEDDYSCRWDYLKISNENNQTFGKYCGQKNRHSVNVSGHYAVISFHSDGSYQRSGYRLTFYFYSNSTSAPFTTNGPYPTGYPTSVPINTGRPTPGTPGPNPQSRLKYYINVCKALLVQMEYIVDNQLGNNSVSVREHKARVKKAIDDVDAALKSDGRQKRDVMKTMMVDQLKKKADELLNKMEAKQGQFKKRTLLKLREKKREAKGRQLIRKTAKTIRDTLDNMVPKKQ